MDNGRKFKKHAFSFLLFLMITGVVLVLIQFANWLPLTLQKETLRRYSSVEEVRASLPALRIYVPTYFPQTISWPPEHLFAQNRPFPWILMKFNHRDSSEEALIINQSLSGRLPGQMPGEFKEVTEKVLYELRGRQAILEVGVCRNGEQCSRINWREGEYQLTVFMTAAPFDLIKIAESMLH